MSSCLRAKADAVAAGTVGVSDVSWTPRPIAEAVPLTAPRESVTTTASPPMTGSPR